ncbi:anti-anti-sigma factor [Actinoplanes octamycinicus]|uniref:Anti-anti-sigma factor n=1 Tax=Actinoplanes octamycinicus TaxID=135948 RepID=A0A7W7H458_9ACTN|nr:STAS domain-containing protein [Actinoplanes octamycinicus]MBB4743634.1 anti-anti-sigma factor [Actinoplanes octamycinicus]GIE61059.1 hypothetical protein Aoc01nite_64610 [Actinoplanes octamycinicus]
MNRSDATAPAHDLAWRVAAETAGPVRLAVTGELDREETGRFHDAIATILAEHPGRPIAIDARGLRFLDAAGIRTLLTCHERAARAGCPLTISHASRIVHDLLWITRLLETFGDPRISDDLLG